jgi:hypothetical protein
MEPTDLPLSPMEKLLLIAAAVKGHYPETDFAFTQTASVVWQAALWAGLDTDDVIAKWRMIEVHPLLYEVYDPLVRMTAMRLRAGGHRAPDRLGPALFEGEGNWGDPGNPGRWPCDPRFNSCRLTVLGEQVARKLLAENPEYTA